MFAGLYYMSDCVCRTVLYQWVCLQDCTIWVAVFAGLYYMSDCVSRAAHVVSRHPGRSVSLRSTQLLSDSLHHCAALWLVMTIGAHVKILCTLLSTYLIQLYNLLLLFIFKLKVMFMWLTSVYWLITMNLVMYIISVWSDKIYKHKYVCCYVNVYHGKQVSLSMSNLDVCFHWQPCY